MKLVDDQAIKATQVSFEEFAKVEFRVGTIVKVEDFPKARKPAYKIWVDFGEAIGVKQTSAQIVANYIPTTLVGKQVVGVLNLGTKNIGGFTSEFLLTGLEDEKGNVVVLTADKTVPNGKKVF